MFPLGAKIRLNERAVHEHVPLSTPLLGRSVPAVQSNSPHLPHARNAFPDVTATNSGGSLSLSSVPVAFLGSCVTADIHAVYNGNGGEYKAAELC